MKLFIGVGIDRYNTGITPLCGAANDVRYLGMAFEQMGFECVILTDEDMRAGRSVSSTLEEQVRRLGDGDLLVFFFAGHGKTITSPQPDQLLLLHDVTRRSLDAGFTNNTLSLRQIALETSQPGLLRVLIIDACRMPIEQEKADSRDAGEAIQFAGEAVFRDVARCAPRKTELNDRLSPIAVLNSCSDGQRAMEIKTQRRGLYALSLQRVMQETRERGKPIVLDSAFDADVERAMDMLAAAHQLDRGQQKPVRQGEEMRLYGQEDSRNNEIRQLLARFEEQLARDALDTLWNDNGRDTLAMLGAKGLPFEEQQALRQRLQVAIDARDTAKREQDWAVQCEIFERQFAAGRFDAPFDDNCSDTLRHLRQLHLPEPRLKELRRHLQEALDTRQRNADCTYDENLIALARQTPSKTLYLNYLNQSRLHEHDQEARDFIAADDRNDEEARLYAEAQARPGSKTWQAYLDRFPQGRHADLAHKNLADLIEAEEAVACAARDAKRQKIAEDSNTLSAWQECRHRAETDDLRRLADQQTQRLQGIEDLATAARAALTSDQAMAKQAASEAMPLTAWRKFQTSAETDWGRNEARQAIDKLEAADRLAWLAACESDDEKSYTAYLLRQPEGGQRVEAEKRRLAKAYAAEMAAQRAGDSAAWATAKDTRGSLAKRRQAIQAYLDAWPQGDYRVAAQNALASLKDTEGAQPPTDGIGKPWRKPAVVMAVIAALGGGTVVLLNAAKKPPVEPAPSLHPAPAAAAPLTPPPKPLPAAPAAAVEPTSNKATERKADEPVINVAAWEAQTARIQNIWWGSEQASGKNKLGESERQWVTQTIALAETGESVLAQLALATLYCRGIAEPQLAHDPKACGTWLAKALANPLLPDGKKGENLADGAAILFDKWVPSNGGPVNRDFAQAIVPGLKAQQQKRPYLGFRLALVQGCYLNPPDKAAAKNTLQDISTSGTPADKEKARRMLEDLNQAKPAICRD